MSRSRHWTPMFSWIWAVVGVVLAAPASAGQGAAEQVTFSRDIAPILQRSCQICHRPNAAAPMSLITYEEVRPWARAIKLRTGLRSKPDAMPPWYMEKNVGIQKFKNDISLSDAEIDQVARWVDSGAPRGNPADMPRPLVFDDDTEWKLGKPDLIVSTPTVDVGANDPDWWGPIGSAETGLTEDRYVASVEMREVNDLPPGKTTTIGGRFTFHHLVWSTIGPDGKPESGASTLRWPVHEVGRNADILDPEAGRLLKGGSKLVFPSAHLHSPGQATKARVLYGFKFHPKGYTPTKEIRAGFGGAVRDIDLRGNEDNQKLESFSTLTENTKIVTFEPHMHAAGVRMCIDAIWATTIETLNCVGYNHSWVRVYAYANDAAPLLPKGTILRLRAYFDTTSGNKNVSDPRNWQGMGHRSMDNMMFNLGQGYNLTDQEFEQEMAKRREQLRTTEGQSVPGCPLCSYPKPFSTANVSQQQ